VNEELRYFVPEVEAIIGNLVNLKPVIKELIKQIKNYSRTGTPIDEELLETLFNTYYQLAMKVSELHKRWVIDPFVVSGEPPHGVIEETTEEIIIKLFDFTKEYEKVIMKFARAPDDEKINMLKSLMSSIDKYRNEIDALITKLEEAVIEGETEEETLI
jgi:hypothetical protein